jgi:hypothetical protein
MGLCSLKDGLKNVFFQNEKFTIGWNEKHAKDLYEAVSQLKVGDIIYLKSISPAYIRNIKIKGIGIVTKSFIQCLQDKEYTSTDISDWSSFFIKVKWIALNEFTVKIPEDEGKLTNIRPATFYEEYLPFVQEQIINKIFTKFTV